MDIEFLINHSRFPTILGVVTLDASMNERHSKKSRITQHPIESGSDVTDHIQRLPRLFDVSGVITNTPIVFLPSVNSRSPVEGDNGYIRDRVKRAHEAFNQAWINGDLIAVETRLESYERMAIVDYAVTVDKDSGNILDFTMALQEIIVVETKQVLVPTPKNPVNAGTQDNGSQQVKKADDGIIRSAIAAEVKATTGSDIPQGP